MKIAGNSAFGKGKYEEALGLYRDGLVELPVRTKVAVIKDEGKGKEKATGEEEGDEKIDKEESVKAVPEVKDESGSDDVEEEEMRELRSILFANVAACLLKLVSWLPFLYRVVQYSYVFFVEQERWKDAVTACDDGELLSFRSITLNVRIQTLADNYSSRSQPKLYQSAYEESNGFRSYC